MNDLLTRKNLRESGVADDARRVARDLTLRVIWDLGYARMRAVLEFLNQSDLIAAMDFAEEKDKVRQYVLDLCGDNEACRQNLRQADILVEPGLIPKATIVELTGAMFSRADLTAIDLARVDLSGANFVKASLHRANLLNSDLRNADLSAADLKQTNLRGTNLSGAILAEVLLSGAQYDQMTQWPAGFDPEAAGATLAG